MKFLSHHGVLRVGAQSWSGQIFEQHGVVHRFRRWRDRIAETDVHLQRDASTVQLRLQVDAYAAVAGFLADDRGPHGGWVKRNAILRRDLANRAESRNCGVDVVRSESKQVSIARRPMRLVVPKRKQQGALQQVVRGVRRN